MEQCAYRFTRVFQSQYLHLQYVSRDLWLKNPLGALKEYGGPDWVIRKLSALHFKCSGLRIGDGGYELGELDGQSGDLQISGRR